MTTREPFEGEPSTLEECRRVLEEIARVAMPRVRGLPTTEKIDQLEFYLMQTAELRQRALLAKLIVQQALDVLQDEWADLEGWEVELPTNGKRTASEVLEAKRRTNRDLYSSIQTGKRLVDRLSEQVRRLEKDDQVCSRAFTFITGSG